MSMPITIPNTQRPTKDLWLQKSTGSEFIVGTNDVIRPNKSGSKEFSLSPDLCTVVSGKLTDSPFWSSLNVQPKAIGGKFFCFHRPIDKETTVRRFRELQLSLFEHLKNENTLIQNYFPRVYINNESGGTAIHHDYNVLLSLAYSFPDTPGMKFGELSLIYDDNPPLQRPHCIERNASPTIDSKPYDANSMAEYTPRFQGAGQYTIIIFRDDKLYHEATSNSSTDPYSSPPNRCLDIISDRSPFTNYDLTEAKKLFFAGKDIMRQASTF